MKRGDRRGRGERKRIVSFPEKESRVRNNGWVSPTLNEKTEKSRDSCGISKNEALLASRLIQGSANSRGYLLQTSSEASDRLPFLLPSQVLSSGFQVQMAVTLETRQGHKASLEELCPGVQGTKKS